MTNLVFVYGTLMQGHGNNRLMGEGSEYVCEGRLEGYRMFDVAHGAYPGIVPSNDRSDVVWGEIWEVDNATLETLDCLEGVPHLYERHSDSVWTNDADRVQCNVYVWRRGVATCPHIWDGDWHQYSYSKLS